MSTDMVDESCGEAIEHCNDLQDFVRDLECDPGLFCAERLQERLAALDRLDAKFGGFDAGAFTNEASSRIHARTKELQRQLEAANAELYRSVRSEIIRGDRPNTLLPWIQESANPSPGLSFDWQDELVSGIFQFSDPHGPDRYRWPEMAPFQPTPVRHILQLLATTLFSEDDVFVDLGSGLGHVPLLVSMLTGVRSVGVEIQAAYVSTAQECAESLRLNRVRFVAEDARMADLSLGTVFYLYSPFTGSILTDVLSMLRRESMQRFIKICSLGPCTRIVANETWLQTRSWQDTERITVFHSR